MWATEFSLKSFRILWIGQVDYARFADCSQRLVPGEIIDEQEPSANAKVGGDDGDVLTIEASAATTA